MSWTSVPYKTQQDD